METDRRSSFLHTVPDRSRRDSVVSLEGHHRSRGSVESLRRTSVVATGTGRKCSLRPPVNVYNEEHEGLRSRETTPAEDRDLFDSNENLKDSSPAQTNHTVTCPCGRVLTVPCERSTVVLSEVEKKMPHTSTLQVARTSSSRRLSVSDALAYIQLPDADHDGLLRCCKGLEEFATRDTIQAVMSRDGTISSLLDVIKRYADKTELTLQACKALLRQAQTTEASLSYIVSHDGIKTLYDVILQSPDDRNIQSVVLDIFGYISSIDNLRERITQAGYQSKFLSVMSRHESDPTIVRQCVTIIGNLVTSEQTARSLMYVGGVHCIVSMMKKYDKDLDVLRHCCTTLGTFSSHESTCTEVAETGATTSVMSAMTSHVGDVRVQEAACWALACFSKQESVSRDLCNAGALSSLLKTMTTYPDRDSIQMYGCWALCNMAILDDVMSAEDEKSALKILTTCARSFRDDVELQEQLCFCLSHFVTQSADVQVAMVRGDGLKEILTSMKMYEENVDVQYNGCRIIGNLAVNRTIRRAVEGLGASDAVVRAMLTLDQHQSIQQTGCMALTNLSADVTDNKLRILQCGGINAILNAMRSFHDDGEVELCALKTLCNLLESDKACWSLAEDGGIPLVIAALTEFHDSIDIKSFGCLALSLLPRKGMTTEPLQQAEEALTQQQTSRPDDDEVALYLISFYENVLTTGYGCKELFTKASFQTVQRCMEAFADNSDLQVSGCKIMAQLALDGDVHLFDDTEIHLLLKTMEAGITDRRIQIVCCATVSYLSETERLRGLLSDNDVVSVLLTSVRQHIKEVQLLTLVVMALENICREGLSAGVFGEVTEAVGALLREHVNEKELQMIGCGLLASIATADSIGHEEALHERCTKPLYETLRRGSAGHDVIKAAAIALGKVLQHDDSNQEKTIKYMLPNLDTDLLPLILNPVSDGAET